MRGPSCALIAANPRRNSGCSPARQYGAVGGPTGSGALTIGAALTGAGDGVGTGNGVGTTVGAAGGAGGAKAANSFASCFLAKATACACVSPALLEPV